MKKTLLATAIIGALGASAAAQAATVYDQDGTRLDIYGRIAMGIEGGGPEYNSDDELIDNSEEFVNVGSRLGFRMSHAITSDLTAFGRLEWRFTGDQRSAFGSETVLNQDGDVDVTTGSGGFDEIRQSYLGVESKQYGTLQAGNFDAFYNQFVSLPFDVYINKGFEFEGSFKQSRGDSIGYYTPDLEGFTAFLQLKHYSERGADEPVRDEGNVVAAQGGVRYAQGPFTVGLGFIEDTIRGGGNGEMQGGLIGSYDVNDEFSVRLGWEGREQNDTLGGGFDTVGLGGTYATGPWAVYGDIYDVSYDSSGEEDRTSWALGTLYKVSSNFDVFLELNQEDQQSINIEVDGLDSNVSADGDDVYYLTGARYHF